MLSLLAYYVVACKKGVLYPKDSAQNTKYGLKRLTLQKKQEQHFTLLPLNPTHILWYLATLAMRFESTSTVINLPSPSLIHLILAGQPQLYPAPGFAAI